MNNDLTPDQLLKLNDLSYKNNLTQHVFTMPQASKDKWLTALRSGEYKQGTGWLHTETDNAYCCLGVLQHCLTGEVEDDILPTIDWCVRNNINYANNSINIDGIVTSFPALNDFVKLSFSQIADIIESQVEGI
jgi:hypothetical protein